MTTVVIKLPAFPAKFATDGLLFRTDQKILYRNTGTFASPVFEDLAASPVAPGIFGDGTDGDLTESSGTTTVTETKYYNNVTLTGSAILTANEPMLIFIKGTLTVSTGALVHMDAKGGTGGAGGTIGPSGGGAGGPAPSPPTIGTPGAVGSAISTVGQVATNGVAGIAGVDTTGGGGEGGNSGAPLPSAGGASPSNAGVGASGGTLSRTIKNIHVFLGQDTVATGIGAGGTGGSAAGRGGGGGGGAGGPNSGQPGGPGGGGGGGGAAGGTGGNGGGTLVIVARVIDLQSGGLISSDGGDGNVGNNNPGSPLNGTNGSAGGLHANGGGGGGGSSADGGTGGSAWAFLNTENGDVLKPASFKAPAKHARGNIYDAHGGMGTVGVYGPAYMR